MLGGPPCCCRSGTSRGTTSTAPVKAGSGRCCCTSSAAVVLRGCAGLQAAGGPCDVLAQPCNNSVMVTEVYDIGTWTASQTACACRRRQWNNLAQAAQARTGSTGSMSSSRSCDASWSLSPGVSHTRVLGAGVAPVAVLATCEALPRPLYEPNPAASHKASLSAVKHVCQV